MNTRPALFLVLLLVALCSRAAADDRAALWLPSLFSDRMVLQQGKPVPVWGRSKPGSAVEVRFQGQSVATRADADGRWTAILAPLQAAKTGTDLAIATEGENRVIRDVVVGEVWLMSGQSNMAFLMTAISKTPEILGSERRAEAAKAPKGPSLVKAEADIAAANDPLLRTYRVHSISAERVREDAVSMDGWMAWNRENAGRFAAMAYYFGEKLRKELDVPVGIILCAWGGSSACSWISADALRSPGLREFFPEDVLEWGTNLAPSRLYNGMLRPVAPFAISGFCWYQGETEATELQNAFVYRHLLAQLIPDWRKAWHESTLPFYLVQLPPWNNSERWEIVRESQESALSLPRTGLVPTLDIVPPGDLHPKNKHAVASRLADLVLADRYGKKTWPGIARFDRAEPLSGALKITFRGTDTALKTSDGAPPAEFQLAGVDRIFHPAEAVIDGSSVIVRSAEVPSPVAVRYAWSAAPKVNLFNAGGLPILPFRSDDWPVAGQEMMPQPLPVKAELASQSNGGALVGKASTPWQPSEAVAGQVSARGALAVKGGQLRIQVRGFPARAGDPSSPALFWTATPDIMAEKGLTLEAAISVYEAGHARQGFDIEAGVPQKDGTLRRYRLTVFPSRIYTFQNTLGARVPDGTQTRLLRSDEDQRAHVFRLAIRADGVAQIYDGTALIGTTRGETVSSPKDGAYLRVGKTVSEGVWAASLFHLAYDTGGAYAPGDSAGAPLSEVPDDDGHQAQE